MRLRRLINFSDKHKMRIRSTKELTEDLRKLVLLRLYSTSTPTAFQKPNWNNLRSLSRAANNKACRLIHWDAVFWTAKKVDYVWEPASKLIPRRKRALNRKDLTNETSLNFFVQLKSFGGLGCYASWASCQICFKKFSSGNSKPISFK